MIRKYDLYHMHQGIQLDALRESELSLLKPVQFTTKKKNHALLLLHGFSSSPAVFRQMLPALKKQYDAIFCPVLAGHGESIDTFSMVKAEDWLNDGASAFQSLSHEYQKVDVLGLSLGGLIACYLSQRFPIHHLYLLAPALSLRLWIEGALQLANALKLLGFSQIRNAAGNLMQPDNTEIAYCRLPISTIREILTLVHHFKFEAPSCPSDLFLGWHDFVINPYKVSQLFANQEHVNIHWLKNSAHVLPLDFDMPTILDVIQQNNQVTCSS